MLAHPDPATFQLLPWRGEGPSTARMFCDIMMPDGSPSYADPRFVLKRTLQKAAEQGFTFYTHTPRSSSTSSRAARAPARTRSRSTAAATSTTPPSRAAPTSARGISMLESMGISVEFSHHEAAPASRRSTCATPTRCRRPTTS